MGRVTNRRRGLRLHGGHGLLCSRAECLSPPLPPRPLEPQTPCRRDYDGELIGLTLPPPRVSALLVLVFLGFGVILGGAAGSRVDDTLAASARPPIKLILPRTAPRPDLDTRLHRRLPAIARERTAAIGTARRHRPRQRQWKAPRRHRAPTTPPRGRRRRRIEAKLHRQEKQKSSAPSSGGRRRADRPVRSGALDLEASAGQARVRDHALRSALRGGLRTVLHGALPVADLEQKRGELLVRYYAVAHEELGERDRAPQRPGADAADGAELPDLRRADAGDRRRPRTGQRAWLRVSLVDADARGAADRQAPDVEGVCRRDGRSGRGAGRERRVRPPGAGRGRPDIGADAAGGSVLRDVQESVCVLPRGDRLAGVREGRRRPERSCRPI